jgi:hypothetical protein
MATITKHIGLHNAAKVIVLMRELPEEEHMALVLLNDKLPQVYHAPVLEALNSAAGQAANNLADIIDTVKLPDGRSLAYLLHTEGFIKKVQTNNVFMTPDSTNKIRLSELNAYMNAISKGGDALKKMQELDEHRGMHQSTRIHPSKVLRGQNVLTEVPVYKDPLPSPPPPAPLESAAPAWAGELLNEVRSQKEVIAELSKKVELLESSPKKKK